MKKSMSISTQCHFYSTKGLWHLVVICHYSGKRVEVCHFPVNANFFTLNATLFGGKSWQVVANLGTGLLITLSLVFILFTSFKYDNGILYTTFCMTRPVTITLPFSISVRNMGGHKMVKRPSEFQKYQLKDDLVSYCCYFYFNLSMI
jgi:hypothetical protein